MELQNFGHNEAPVIGNYPQAKEVSGCHGCRLPVNRRCLGEVVENSGWGTILGFMKDRPWGGGSGALQRETSLPDP